MCSPLPGPVRTREKDWAFRWKHPARSSCPPAEEGSREPHSPAGESYSSAGQACSASG